MGVVNETDRQVFSGSRGEKPTLRALACLNTQTKDKSASAKFEKREIEVEGRRESENRWLLLDIQDERIPARDGQSDLRRKYGKSISPRLMKVATEDMIEFGDVDSLTP